MAVAHPPEVTIEIGGRSLTLKPWTMAQRVKIRPVLGALLGHLSLLDGGFAKLGNAGLVDLFLVAEEQIAAICRASLGDLVTEAEWDEMAWEELPVIAQALWSLNVVRPDGGGVLGKLGAGLGTVLAAARQTTPSSPMDLSTIPSTPMDSPSCAEGDTATPN